MVRVSQPAIRRGNAARSASFFCDVDGRRIVSFLHRFESADLFLGQHWIAVDAGDADEATCGVGRRIFTRNGICADFAAVDCDSVKRTRRTIAHARLSRLAADLSGVWRANRRPYLLPEST